MRLIVGLGNPGERYAGTRHNVGFEVVDELARKRGLVWKYRKEWCAEVAEGDLDGVGRYFLMKPQTYMNRSGEAVRVFLDWWKWGKEDVLVVVDDVALALGRIRVRERGADGGHNGLRSVEGALGSRDYARVRCGVGGVPEGWALEDYVLSRFSKSEAAVLKEMVLRGADAVSCCQEGGLSLAMTLFNKRVIQ
jgi:PTH1 family peptidyl-tRNA hydrolase